MIKSVLAVIIGGSVGCLIRWLIALRFNALLPYLSAGTLIVNLVGGFIIGMATAYFMKCPQLDPAWRLLIVTGLCGGMTTFSTFSAEIMLLMQSGNYLWALFSMMSHVLGSLLMVFAGFSLVNML